MAAVKHLISLIDLSLGVEPHGVVNFNYLHGLLHEIVNKLAEIESAALPVLESVARESQYKTSSPKLRSVSVKIEEQQEVEPDKEGKKYKVAKDHKELKKDGDTKESRGEGDKEKDVRDGKVRKDDKEMKKDKDVKEGKGEKEREDIEAKKGMEVQEDIKEIKKVKSDKKKVKSDKQMKGDQEVEEDVGMKGDEYEARAAKDIKDKEMSEGKDEERKDSKEAKDLKETRDLKEAKDLEEARDVKEARDQEARDHKEVKQDKKMLEDKSDKSVKKRWDYDSEVDIQDRASPDETRVSSSTYSRGSSGKRYVDSSYSRSRVGIVTAANDLSTLERKMTELERRINTMESLPDMLERKSSDVAATPVSDMWNFSNLNNRLSAAEDGLGKTSRLVDDLLGEFHDLRSQVAKQNDAGRKFSNQMSTEVDDIYAKLKDLEGLKLASVQDSMGDVASVMLENLDSKIEDMQGDINSLKSQISEIDLSKFVTFSDLDDALKEHSAALQKHESTLESQAQSMSELEESLSLSTEEVKNLTDKVGGIEEELNKLMEMTQEIQTGLCNKVNASDLMSLMSQTGDSGEAASLMPKLLELQTKLNLLESKVGVPPDLLDQITVMKKSIDALTNELSSLSALVHTLQSKPDMEDKGRLDDLCSQIAQLRERINEIDRGLSALGEHMSGLSLADSQDVKTGGEAIDAESLNLLQGMVAQLQQEQERLIGTAAHFSHELDVNKEHLKSLYDRVDNLNERKADKAQVEVEVKEKADRRALEDKASRDWVDSTFERLDKEIRDAKSRLIGQEEAFKMAVSQLNEDVDGKLDRMELQPLKEYFDKKLDSVKITKIESTREPPADDAAGFRKPLRFHCISCDRPVDLKQLSAIPALPSITTLPGTRSFRPYTTYELELIRRHQKLVYPIPHLVGYSRSNRSAGGVHTLTHPHQRIRTAPFGNSSYAQESYSKPANRSSPMIHEETDLVGQDGHIYKGRMTQSKLPPLTKNKRRPRPSSTPYHPTRTF